MTTVSDAWLLSIVIIAASLSRPASNERAAHRPLHPKASN